jgi:hypothetical protein
MFTSAASFAWLISGGGLTRSFGLLFAVLAIYHLYLLTRSEASGRRVLMGAAFVSLTLLSHQEMAWMTAFFYAVILFAYMRSLKDLARPAAVSLLALALTSPWWGLVIARHGLDAYLAALDSGALNPLGAAGLAAAFALSRRWFLPALVLGVLFFEDRNFYYPLSISLSLLVGWCCIDMVLPVLRRSGQRDATPALRWKRAALVSGSVGALVIVNLVWLVMSYGIAVGSLGRHPAGEAESFAWVAANTPADSRFLVLADSVGWAWDYTSEWFPALAGRRSVATVQGSEWLRGAGGFKSTNARDSALRRCAPEGTSCLEQWAQDWNAAFTHVYVYKSGWASSLRASLRASPEYALVFEGASAQIYARR